MKVIIKNDDIRLTELESSGQNELKPENLVDSNSFNIIEVFAKITNKKNIRSATKVPPMSLSFMIF